MEPQPPSSSLCRWKARIVSWCCAGPLRVTLNPLSPSKSGSYPCPRCSLTAQHHPSVMEEGRMCPLSRSRLSPRSGPSVSLGLLVIRLSSILIEVPLGLLPQCQPAHTLLPHPSEALGNPGRARSIPGEYQPPHTHTRARASPFPRGKKSLKSGQGVRGRSYGLWDEALPGLV